MTPSKEAIEAARFEIAAEVLRKAGAEPKHARPIGSYIQSAIDKALSVDRAKRGVESLAREIVNKALSGSDSEGLDAKSAERSATSQQQVANSLPSQLREIAEKAIRKFEKRGGRISFPRTKKMGGGLTTFDADKKLLTFITRAMQNLSGSESGLSPASSPRNCSLPTQLREIAKRYAADDRLWTTQETVESNLTRAMQEATTELQKANDELFRIANKYRMKNKELRKK